jgi:hypothetical protein
MPTFAQLKTRVSRKLIDPNNTAVSASDVGDAINDAIKYWKYSRFWFNETTATVTLNVSDQVVPNIPSDFLYEDQENGFVILYDQITYTLTKKHPKEFDRISIQNATGLPSVYTWRNGVYTVYFQPNIAYTMNIYYIKDYVDLSADDDSNDFTTFADQLITYEAVGRLTGEDRQDSASGSEYLGRADREFKNLTNRTSKQTASGRLDVDTILTN